MKKIGYWFFLTAFMVQTSVSRDIESMAIKELQDLFPEAHIQALSTEKPLPLGIKVAYSIYTKSTLQSYAILIEPVSLSGPFQALVVVSPEQIIQQVSVINYPHTRGRNVKRKRFLKQFKNQSLESGLNYGEEIDGASGASSSSQELTCTIRRALEWLNTIDKALTVNKDE